MIFRVLLPAEFQDSHRRVALDWVGRGHEFSLDEWRIAIRAFDLLREAAIVTEQGLKPFPIIYHQIIETPHVDNFIQALLNANDVEQTGIANWAEIATSIPAQLNQAGLSPSHQPAARLLVVYCLYWWYAFAHGYIFEVEVLRDLAQSGVKFTTHDLTRREERLSAWDLEVLGFRGDIKRSLLFLQTKRARRLPHSFYIIRLKRTKRWQTIVVMMHQAMWRKIDGETIWTTLSEIGNILPGVAQVNVSGLEVVVAEYTFWKDLVIKHQSGKSGE